MKSLLSLTTLLLLAFSSVFAKDNIGMARKANKGLRISAACSPSTSSVEMDVNNVRCLLHNGGDMWWDLVGNPRYEVPKVDNPADRRHSSFAGSLWIGGVDESGQLKVAAQTYRQSGYDFWPGPLTSNGAVVDDVVCEEWDKHFKITRAEINAFRAAFTASQATGASFSVDDYPAVKDWPWRGEDSEGNTVFLAPFVDVDNDEIYNPENGDYPDIAPCPGGGQPDMAIWWVLNDKGDIHTETGGEAIGLEIQMLAFAFTTANAINDMTFYKYKVINKSSLVLNETYMGQWVDADIGLFSDDYVGCDTVRGLGFAYNGDADDDGATGYGLNPPALGMDFFQGPIADPDDGVDNDKDGLVDEPGERIGMSKFVYYENDFSLRGNPEVATHFYGYLRGFWKDGSAMVANGENGYQATGSGPETNYMYPGNGGWCSAGQENGWHEGSASGGAGNQPFDRRFLQSAGPFTLQPGAVNEIITGCVWARGFYNDHKGSVCELLQADDVAQALFDACFQLLDGPDAPPLTINEYDSELMISWNYTDDLRTIVNNWNEGYEQDDPVLVAQGVNDPTFEFEGYMIFQLKDNTVSASELFDPDKARLIAQCDIENGITAIENTTATQVGGLQDPIIVQEVMVEGNDEGIFKSLRVSDDQFAQGNDRRLRNYTTYYYGAIAYATNGVSSDGRKFVQGNRFFQNYAATPHPIDFENVGTSTNSDYGDGVIITQIAGVGNGGNFVQLDADTESDIITNSSVSELTYQSGAAPIDVQVVNPKEVQALNYKVDVVQDQFASGPDTVTTDSTGVVFENTYNEWILYSSPDGNNWSPIYTAQYTIRTDQNGNESFRQRPLSGKEHVIEDHGISIRVKDVEYAGRDSTENPIIGATLSYDDNNFSWLLGVPDVDNNFAVWDWIQAGEEDGDRNSKFMKYNPATGDVFPVFDKNGNFETILNGSWAPYCLTRFTAEGASSGNIGPGRDLKAGAGGTASAMSIEDVIQLDDLPDIDVVFTSDHNLWSDCVVIETAPDQDLGSGAWPRAARWEGNRTDWNQEHPDSNFTVNNYGMGLFPGYAINVNTGERLNIFFGESSWDIQNNGNDMMWNPTNDAGPGGTSVGGRHFIWVTNQPYDGCADLYNILANENFSASSNTSFFFQSSTQNNLDDAYKHVAWVGLPLVDGSNPFDNPLDIPTTARVSIRVNQPWRSRANTTDIPIFRFSTEDIAAQINQSDIATDYLENIRVVPNPYYAFSRYESSQLQTLVKITNLPQQCTIKIFTLNGTLIRTFKKDSDEPDQAWDLKNHAGVPIASGVYIIHVDAGDLGEKIVKFFGVLPQIDLESY